MAHFIRELSEKESRQLVGLKRPPSCPGCGGMDNVKPYLIQEDRKTTWMCKLCFEAMSTSLAALNKDEEEKRVQERERRARWRAERQASR